MSRVSRRDIKIMLVIIVHSDPRPGGTRLEQIKGLVLILNVYSVYVYISYLTYNPKSSSVRSYIVILDTYVFVRICPAVHWNHGD